MRAGLLLAASLAGASALLQPVGHEVLGYAAASVDGGQLWRLLTASFVHLTWSHWAMNAAGAAAVLCIWSAWLSPWRLLGFGLLAAPLHLAALHLAGSLDWGAGFSGPLHAMVAHMGFALIRQPEPRLARFGRVTLAGPVAKLAIEGLPAWQAVAAHDFPVAPAMHWSAVTVAVAWELGRRAVGVIRAGA